MEKESIEKDFEIKECQWISLKKLFIENHYLNRMPAGILACYGIFEKHNMQMPKGGAIFCNGRIQYDKKYIEFSRLWISDELGKNIESYFIAKCIKLIQKKFSNYIGIVTWADCNKNHNGTVYMASNFIFDGMSRNVKKYIGKDRRVIFQRTATKDDKLISEDLPKKRFIYYFDKKVRESKRTPFHF